MFSYSKRSRGFFLFMTFLTFKVLKELKVRKSMIKYGEGYNPDTKQYG
jgi:hypothetical protein